LGFAAVCVLTSGCKAGPPKSAEEVAHSKHNHDGFYMRLATGLGVYNEQSVSESDERYQGKVHVRARGFASASEFALGGTPYPGLVIGGGAFSTEVVTSSVTTNRDDDPDVELAEDLELESRDLSVVGVFADRYFVPRLGLHVQAALGFAQQYGLSVDAPAQEDGNGAVGPGGVLGIGYEMWIGEQWSLGVLARIGGSVLFSKDSLGVKWVHYSWSMPSFLMSVTYH